MPFKNYMIFIKFSGASILHLHPHSSVEYFEALYSRYCDVYETPMACCVYFFEFVAKEKPLSNLVLGKGRFSKRSNGTTFE